MVDDVQDRPDLDGKAAGPRGLDLDEVLGARSRVAVLRHLVRVPHNAWPTHLVRWTRLSRSSVWEALWRLEALGVVEPAFFEHGGRVPWRIHPHHLLREPLKALFLAERQSWMSAEELEADRAFRARVAKLKVEMEAKGIPFDESVLGL